LIGVITAVTVACQDSPTSPDQAKPIAAHRVHPDCIEGCWGPDLDVRLSWVTAPEYIRKGTLYLPDSIAQHPPVGLVVFEVGPNTADTAIRVATVADADCSNDCVELTSTGDGPTSPNPLLLDPGDSAEVYVNVTTHAPGTGWLSLAAGAGYVQIPVVVFHCAWSGGLCGD
jgi:hypothetical protein